MPRQLVMAVAPLLFLPRQMTLLLFSLLARNRVEHDAALWCLAVEVQERRTLLSLSTAMKERGR